MAFGLLNLAMLFGLLGLAIPVIIHLLNRRRFEVVDWGAMRFLQMSEATRRRVFIEEMLLMLLRMGLIALLVLAMCAPFASSKVFEWMGFAENRDIVLVFDGSTAMSFINDDGKTAHDEAVEWAKKMVGQLSPGDTVAILQAREQAVPYLDSTSDVAKVRETLDKLAAPGGDCDWQGAVATAHEMLKKTSRSRRDVILLGAGRKEGWADPADIQRWEDLAPQVADGKSTLRLWMVSFADKRSEELPNWSLSPFRAGRVGPTTAVTFRSSIRVQGQKYERPYRLYYKIDQPPGASKPADDENLGGEIELPKTADLRDGVLPLTFPFERSPGDEGKAYKRIRKLPGPGSHLVSLIVEPDPPKGERAPDAKVRDRLAGDNRRDFAVNIPLIPVLIVDGLPPKLEEYQGGDFLQAAIQPHRAKITESRKAVTATEEELRNRLIRAKVEPLADLEAALKRDVGPETNTRPRVLVLCDVPTLTHGQQDAIETFVNAGGSLLVNVGPRAVAAHYNKDLYQDGAGWLPAKLDKPLGDENEPLPKKDGDPDRAAHPLPATFTHDALNEFRRNPIGSIDLARFPKWWHLVQPLRLTDESIEGLREEGVPDAVLTKLADLKDGKSELEEPFVQGLARVLDADELSRYKAAILSHARTAATVGAYLSVRDPKPERSPWLIEKRYGKGRVLLCSTPLDDSWGTNVYQFHAFPVLANELVAYLAGTHLTESRVAPGQPIVYNLLDDERGAATKTQLKTPRNDKPVELEEKDGQVVFKDTRLSGVYVMTTPRNRTVYFVVRPDETDTGARMTPLTENDRKKVADVMGARGLDASGPGRAAAVPLAYTQEAEKVLRGPDRDLWWLFIVGVTALLCGEVWMTRKIAKGR